jgi:hypothetical protein
MPPRRRKTPLAPEPLTFRTPEWPERTCREPVAGEYAAYSCEVVEAHLGPHASQDVPASVALRAAWEKANPAKLEPTAEADPFIDDGR